VDVIQSQLELEELEVLHQIIILVLQVLLLLFQQLHLLVVVEVEQDQMV
jgi:hypothetical protein